VPSQLPAIRLLVPWGGTSVVPDDTARERPELADKSDGAILAAPKLGRDTAGRDEIPATFAWSPDLIRRKSDVVWLSILQVVNYWRIERFA
jgi:hypothetical protein